MERGGVTATRAPAVPDFRSDLCNLRPLQIPRPKCTGMQFVQTRGRQGFYLSIRRRGYGIELPDQGPKRPPLAGVFRQPSESSNGDTDSLTVSEMTEKSSSSDSEVSVKKNENPLSEKAEFVEKL